ncbi:hypothetical protein [Streptomyces sp. NPDC006739]|uniref:hypothetical protein n=1 Tax=Streptomyces sp. NPDC006739 TaxID=3364763 RepID=UPI0036BB4784
MAGRDIYEYLQQLRELAGDPSIREIEKLTATQGRGRAMSRATIQDKFSGKSAPKVIQLLALVEACIAHARSIDISIPPEETSLEIWRKRLADSKAGEKVRSGNPKQETSSISSHTWDLEPLKRAAMWDVVRLVENSRETPLHEWMPFVVESLKLASMDDEEFLGVASTEGLDEVVALLIKLGERDDELARKLWKLCLKNQPPEMLPPLLASLRRSESEYANMIALSFVESSLEPHRWGTSHRKDIAEVIKCLRAASMNRDADALVEAIGAHVRGREAIRIAEQFPEEFMGDRERILMALPGQGPANLVRVITEANQYPITDRDNKKIITLILHGIPSHRSAEFSNAFTQAGLDSIAQEITQINKDRPF